jgi:transposase
MGKIKDISFIKKIEIIELHRQGVKQMKIATLKTCSQSTVAKIVKEFKENGYPKMQRKYKEREKKTTKRDEIVLNRIVKKNRCNTLKEITQEWNNYSNTSLSKTTVFRRMQEAGFDSAKKRKIPLLTAAQKKKRLVWAKAHKNWTVEQWRNIIWSDESRFCVSYGDGGPRFWRLKIEKFSPQSKLPVPKFPQSIMVWGCMSAEGVGNLEHVTCKINAEEYMDILARGLMPLLEPDELFYGKIFQHDLAPAHAASSTARWMDQYLIEVLEWPGNSPDLNPIENIWGLLKRSLQKQTIKTKDDLLKKLREEWERITPELCKKLIDSIPKRIEAVIRNKGGQTKY